MTTSDQNPPPLTDEEKEVLGVIQEAAAPALTAQRAHLRVAVEQWGPEFHLEPTNPSAAPLKAQVDDPHQITVYLGKHGNALEAHAADRRELLDEVFGVVSAVIRGGYSETVSPDGEKIIGRLTVNGERIGIYLNVWSARLIRTRGWREIEYSAYL